MCCEIVAFHLRHNLGAGVRKSSANIAGAGLGGASHCGTREHHPGRHDSGKSGWHTTQNAPRFLGFRRPGSTVVALLTDSAMRGFAISFFTSRRIASLNALLLWLRSMTPSSCHAPKAKNGQFRPDEEILEMHSCPYNGRPCAGKSAQEPQRPHSWRKMLRREL